MTEVEMINMSKRLENFKHYSNEVYRQAILWQTSECIDQLDRLHKLMEHGAISPEEYKLS